MAAPPLKIGFVGDFNGAIKPFCEDAYFATKLAVEQFNGLGGVLGKEIVLIRKDAGSVPQNHYSVIREMVKQESVAAIFGGGTSECLIKGSQAAGELGIPFLISVGNSQQVVVKNGHPYVFLFEANSIMETKGFSIFITLMPWKKYIWVGPDYMWGHEIFDFLNQFFKEMGGPVQWSEEIWHPLSHADFSGIVSRISQIPSEALFITSYGEDMKQFVREARKQHLFDRIACFSWYMADSSENIYPEGIWTLSRAPFHYLMHQHHQTHVFVKSYHQRFSKYPSGFSICAYDAMLAWKKAVLDAGDASPEKTASALRGISFTSLRGESIVRAVDGQMNCPSFFGRLSYLPEFAFPVLESVIEIPAEKTWLTEEEVLKRREMTEKNISDVKIK